MTDFIAQIQAAYTFCKKNVVIMLFFFVAKFLLYAHYVNLIFGLAVSETCCNAGFVIC